MSDGAWGECERCGRQASSTLCPTCAQKGTEMFKISLRILGFNLYGITALDTRRRFKMTDGTRLNFEGKMYSFGVPEAFARANFAPDEIEATEDVQYSDIPFDCLHLKAGDENSCEIDFLTLEKNAQRVFVSARKYRIAKESKEFRDKKVEETERDKHWPQPKRSPSLRGA